jgi:hypothetical protein
MANKSVTIKPEVEARIANEDPIIICEPDSVWLTIDFNKIDSVIWSTGDKTDSLLVNQAGLFTAKIFNLGCSVNDSVTVEILPQPEKIDSIIGPSWSNPDSIQYFELFNADPQLEYQWEVDGGLLLSTAFDAAEIQWIRDDFGLICVTAIDSGGCMSETFCRMIDLAPLDIQLVQAENVLLYPNPSSGTLNVETPVTPLNRLNIKLEFYNPTGLLISRKSFDLGPESTIKKLDVSDLPPGIYWVKILHENRLLSFDKILLNR